MIHLGAGAGSVKKRQYKPFKNFHFIIRDLLGDFHTVGYNTVMTELEWSELWSAGLFFIEG